MTCLGLGKHLSGRYFVYEVTRKIDNDSGYSQSVSVQKNGFGESLKSGFPKSPVYDEEERASPIPKAVEERRYVVTGTDNIWSIAARLYGDGNLHVRIAEANRMDSGDPFRRLPVGKELIIP